MNLMDRQAVLARVFGDESLLREILGLFLEHTPLRCAAIRTAFEKQDFAEIYRTAHALKGSVGYLEAKLVLSAVQRLEQLANTADTQELPAAWTMCERLLAALLEEAGAWYQTGDYRVGQCA
jgi:HPt (histidine-containing phosphotransfer) domain-containing protein